MKSSPIKLKQKLSKSATAKKKARDIEYASKQYRIDRRSQNQSEGQRSDSDLHHTKSGILKRVSIKNNRGNYGRGTKNE